MADTDRRIRARNAITQAALNLGLPTDLAILSERWNTVALLGNSGVVAKAATLADIARLNPVRWFQQEIDCCLALGRQDAPVQIPVNNQVLVVNGIPVTLWKYIEGETGSTSEQDLVTSLATLHREGQKISLDQPWFATITEEIPATLQKLAERSVLETTTIETLHAYGERLLDQTNKANLDSGFLHGDAQRKNSIQTTDGPVWIDFEETCIGPFAWDLACLAMHARFDVDRVLDQYAQLTGSSRIANQHIEMLQQLRDLESLVWMLAIGHERDHDFRRSAMALMKKVLIDATDG